MLEKLGVLKILKQYKNQFVRWESFLDGRYKEQARLQDIIDFWLEQGYEINVSGEFGLQLTELPDRLYPWELQENLHTHRMGKKIFHYEEIDSTNREALDMAKNGAEEGTVVVSECQRQGRGRFQRVWESPRSKGTYFSFILRPCVPMKSVPQLTLLTGVAVAQSMREVSGCVASVKWPNDILINGKKVCGILAEAKTRKGGQYPEYIVIGVGMNVNFAYDEFPPDIQAVATSLFLESGHLINRVELTRVFLRNFENHYEQFLLNGYNYLRLVWLDYNCTIGHEVSITGHTGEKLSGVAVDLGSNGGIVIKDVKSKELKEYLAGDVSIGSQNFH